MFCIRFQLSPQHSYKKNLEGRKSEMLYEQTYKQLFPGKLYIGIEKGMKHHQLSVKKTYFTTKYFSIFYYYLSLYLKPG